MTNRVFEALLILVAASFTVFFSITIIPALLESGDIVGAALAGFVNPFAAGYSTDVILCWFVLLIWVLYERQQHGIRHGWLCLLLGLVPGVAVGLALYLVLRNRQLRNSHPHNNPA